MTALLMSRCPEYGINILQCIEGEAKRRSWQDFIATMAIMRCACEVGADSCLGAGYGYEGLYFCNTLSGPRCGIEMLKKSEAESGCVCLVAEVTQIEKVVVPIADVDGEGGE